SDREQPAAVSEAQLVGIRRVTEPRQPAPARCAAQDAPVVDVTAQMVAERRTRTEHGAEPVAQHFVLTQRRHQRGIVVDQLVERGERQVWGCRRRDRVEDLPGQVEMLDERDRQRRVLETHPGHDRPGGRLTGRAATYRTPPFGWHAGSYRIAR